MIGATGDEIARVHGHHRCGELDELGDTVLHVVGAVIVAQLPVVPEAHDQVVRIPDLVGCGDTGTDRREGVEGFTEPARERRRRPGAPPLFARGHVDHRRVTKDGIFPVFCLHHLGRALDHQRQFRLVHKNPRYGEFRQHDGIARPDHRVGILHEHIERARLTLRMLPIVGDAGEDFSRPRQRSAQAYLVQRNCVRIPGKRLDRRA